MPKKLITYTLEEFKTKIESLGMKNAAIEKAIGLSNGIIGKVLAGKGNLSEDKWELLKSFSVKTTLEVGDRDQTHKEVVEAYDKQFKKLIDDARKTNMATIEELMKIEGVTTADKIPPPVSPKIEATNGDIFESMFKHQSMPDWASEIELYCEKNGLTPYDLIDCHKNSLKSPKKASLKDVMGEKETKTSSSKYDLFKIKMGIKE